MEYTGEHLAIGMLGRACVAIAFASGLLALLAYVFAARRNGAPDDRFMKLGRQAFRVHSVALLGVIGCLFTIIIQGYYEYHYAWKHISNDLPLQYVFSAFWEGQEGSFLLWGFWQVVLGNILIFSVRNWEGPVMAVMATVQVFITSMLLGIYFFGHKVGSDPFLLIRELPQNLGASWTQNPNYLQDFSELQDGQGLAPLLRNYWMTIHPPTLFLGFASTSIPFAYAIAGLWRRDFSGWLRPALPWTFFGIGILGAGILMGGAWAYEALSFGGFWAWDPVENASLVPWIMLLGAGHLMLINRKRQSSLFTTFLLTLSSFLLVLYSTFLTRSGVLGDSSVHSFTEDGMLAHLLLFLLFFTGLSVLFLLKAGRERWSYAGLSVLLFAIALPIGKSTIGIVLFLLLSIIFLVRAYQTSFSQPEEEEEKLWSREFWVFIGSLVLLLSALQITISTSKPVMNLLAGPFSGLFSSLHEMTGWNMFQSLAQGELAPPSDVIHHYNSWQVPFAFLVSMLAAVGQFLRYGNTEPKRFFKRIGLSFFGSLLLAVLVALFFGMGWKNYSLLALLFASTFTVLANLDYWIRMLRGRFDQAGPSIAHLGFGLIMLGALISQSQSEKISVNRSGFDIKTLSEDFENDKDMILFKGDTVRMGDHFVHYNGKDRGDVRVRYDIEFFATRNRYYQQGAIVTHRGGMFRAKKGHQASDRFLKDRSKYWERLPDPSEKQKERAEGWKSAKPGEKRFELRPRIQLNQDMGNVPEPDTRRSLSRDIYTHIRYAELKEQEKTQDGYEKAQHTVEHGDTIPASSALVRFQGLRSVDSLEKHGLDANDIAAKAIIEVTTRKNEEYRAEPLYIVRDSSYRVPHKDSIPAAGLRFSIDRIHPQKGKVDITIEEKADNSREFIVLQAIVFPMINILWTGCILMVVGSFLAVRNRIRKRKGNSTRKRSDKTEEEAEAVTH